MSDPAFELLQDVLRDLREGQRAQTDSLNKLHEKHAETSVAVADIRGRLGQFATVEDLHAHQEEITNRCLRLHGHSALSEITTKRQRKSRAPWWSCLLHGPTPYLLAALVLVIIIAAIVTGRPAKVFVPINPQEVTKQ